jgi:hypothetical protein
LPLSEREKDCKQASDKINRTEPQNAMGSYCIPKKLVRLLEMTMTNVDAEITVG